MLTGRRMRCESVMKYDLVTVGHIVLDDIRRDAQFRKGQIGGPCVYSCLSARSLNARAGVISKVGRDFGIRRMSWLREHGVSIASLEVVTSPTTCFRINYRNESRTMRVSSVCDPLAKDDFVSFPKTRAIHIGPVLGEVPVSIAHDLTTTDSIVALDPQGYVRQLARNGTVQRRKWRNMRLLRAIDVLKVSDDELSAIHPRAIGPNKIAKLGSNVVLWTRGARGMVLWSRNEGTFEVPTYPVHARNPTGAGDALLGAFLVTWARTSDLLWSASVGMSVASILVERSRPLSFGGRKQVEKRAAAILQRAKRM